MACNNVKKEKKPTKAIKQVYARTIYDSRGIPTVEVDLITNLGLFRASVPAGAITGNFEALEVRDGIASQYQGKGVSKAVESINNVIGPELIEADICVTDQEKIDQFMIDLDGTENKSKYGANAILAVSLAVCKAGAAKRGIPVYRHIADLAGIQDLVIPVPLFNVINGGAHAGNKSTIQEFMIIPTGATSFSEAMKMGAETYQILKTLIQAKFGQDSIAVSEEGAVGPNVPSSKDALVFIRDAIAKAGYTGRIEIALDAAAYRFFRIKEGLYDLDFKNPKSDKKAWMKPDKLNQLYQGYMKDFPIVSIEDPFQSEDWVSWANITANSSIQIVGDDLTVSSPKRIQMAVAQQACNCFLLKVNQIGTVTEVIKAHLLAKSNGWGTMVATRCGETEETFLADLVVGLSTGQIKSGAPCRTDRLAKYNQILRIEEELCTNARFAGRSFRKPL